MLNSKIYAILKWHFTCAFRARSHIRPNFTFMNCDFMNNKVTGHKSTETGFSDACIMCHVSTSHVVHTRSLFQLFADNRTQSVKCQQIEYYAVLLVNQPDSMDEFYQNPDGTKIFY